MSDERPALYGGRFSFDRLKEFLAAWQIPRADMPWRIWEQVNAIAMTPTPDAPDLLERGRVFGEAGDLSIRRDRERVLWHFVGQPVVTPPKAFDSLDFWKSHPSISLTLREGTCLLWGQNVSSGAWSDDRVGRAELPYPPFGTRHVRVSYRAFSSSGQRVAVWWHGLEGCDAGAD